MRDVKVTCDACGRDITSTWNCEGYRLVLRTESKSGCDDGIVTAMACPPEISRSYHFCGLHCLKEKLDKNEIV